PNTCSASTARGGSCEPLRRWKKTIATKNTKRHKKEDKQEKAVYSPLRLSLLFCVLCVLCGLISLPASRRRQRKVRLVGAAGGDLIGLLAFRVVALGDLVPQRPAAARRPRVAVADLFAQQGDHHPVFAHDGAILPRTRRQGELPLVVGLRLRTDPGVDGPRR